MAVIWTVALVLNLGVLVPFLVWKDLRRSDFTVEPKTEAELEAEKKRREELAKKPKPEIPKEQVEQAKKHIEKRKREDLKKEIEELERLKAEIEELRLEQVEALEERDEEHFLDQLVDAVQEQAEELAQRAHDLEQTDRKDEARKLREEAQRLRDQARQIQDPVEQADGSRAVPNADQTRTVADLAKTMADHAADYARLQPSPQASDVQDRAERLARRAESLAGNEAVAALDGFTSELDPTAAELDHEAQAVAAEAAALAQDTAAMQAADATVGSQAVSDQAQSLSQDTQALAQATQAAAAQDATAPPTQAVQAQAAAVAAAADQVADTAAAYATDQPSETSNAVSQRAEALAARAGALAEAAKGSPSAEADQLSTAELYDQARALEREIAAAFADTKAAELALTQETSFQQGLEAVSAPRTLAEDLGSALAQEPGTREELAVFSAAMDQAIANAGRAAENARAQLGQTQGRQQGGPAGEQSLAAALGQAAALGNALSQASLQQGDSRGMMVDLTGLMSQAYGGGSGSQDSGIRAGSNRAAGGEAMGEGVRRTKLDLDGNRIRAQALPGRKFSRDSARTGWLFIDSWYLIGPFENRGKIDFNVRHPPETVIDFDAEYVGKQGRNLGWKYLQSNVMRINPPDEQSNSTYYAFTEVWFEEETDMLLAVASDDAAKVWINDIVVWQDTGLSAWQLDEGFRKVRFKKGFNPILLRVENGPVVCYFSILLCPSDL